MHDEPEPETTPLEPHVGYAGTNLAPVGAALHWTALIAAATILALAGHPVWALVPLLLYIAA
jgi:hypothetical protein